jgi:hypothetical protein
MSVRNHAINKQVLHHLVNGNVQIGIQAGKKEEENFIPEPCNVTLSGERRGKRYFCTLSVADSKILGTFKTTFTQYTTCRINAHENYVILRTTRRPDKTQVIKISRNKQ